MAPEAAARIRIVMYYAVWVAMCAAVAGVIVAGLHTAFFSFRPTRAALLHTLWTDAVTALAMAAGQGAVALVTGSLLAQLGRTLGRTVLLGLLVGLFDLLMFSLQMMVPVTELGWIPDILILVGATAGITMIGARTAPEPL